MTHLHSFSPDVKQSIAKMSDIDKRFELMKHRDLLQVSYKSMPELNLEAVKDYKEH